MSEHAFLHIEDVYKSYGAKRVLDNVDLSVAQGEFCSLVGPSGCGKSTLLRLILGQERASDGRVLIEGRPVGYPDRDRGIVYQRYSLFPHLTVLENVTLGRRLCAGFLGRFQRAEQKAFADEALELLREVSLAEHALKYPHQLSGGMQQRVAVVQALIMKPKILLMDEPFGALDPGTREDIQLFLLELWETHHMTIFLVTHDLEEAVFLGSRLIVLSQHYTDDRGDGPEVGRGARIVADHALKPERLPHPTTDKQRGEFVELIAQIRREGFDPAYRQHVREFNLRHPHSFRTLRPEEDRRT
jgi:NitT/TauT family transport system ATP-binding protein